MKQKILTILFGILIIISLSSCDNNSNSESTDKSIIGSDGFVSLIQEEYPEFKDYPSNNLPPKSIRSKRGDNGWYIAFVQEGSGVPLIGAKCFFVSDENEITIIGELKPNINDTDFDITTCNIITGVNK